MRKFLYIIILISASLACGVQTSLPVVNHTSTATEMSVDVNPTPNDVQISGSWNIRTVPGENSPLVITLTNADVQLINCKPFEGGEWCLVKFDSGQGWVNKKGIITLGE